MIPADRIAAKRNAERVLAIAARLERLEAAKNHGNLGMSIKPIVEWDTDNVILEREETGRALRIGIDTLIAQLESELAGIPVTGAEVKPQRVADFYDPMTFEKPFVPPNGMFQVHGDQPRPVAEFVPVTFMGTSTSLPADASKYPAVQPRGPVAFTFEEDTAGRQFGILATLSEVEP